jgi:hypothetical protein
MAGNLSVTRPSLQKQTSRYEDRLRNEDLAVQAAYEKRKVSKKVQHKSKPVKTNLTKFQPSQEEAFDFFTKEQWAPHVVCTIEVLIY